MRIAYCSVDKTSGLIGTACSKCGEARVPSRLLYPIEKKNYSADEFIENEWENFKYVLKHAFWVTGVQLGTWETGGLNGDGRTDLVHRCCSDYVHAWLSNGDGSFTVKSFRPWSGYGMHLGSWQAGDVDGGGRTDLIHVCCSNHVNVWLSKGDGTFAVKKFSPWSSYDVQAP